MVMKPEKILVICFCCYFVGLDRPQTTIIDFEMCWSN